MTKDLTPISVTVCFSKVSEDCVVPDYIKPAVSRSWTRISIARYLIRPPHRPSYTWSTAGLKRQAEIALRSGLCYSIIEEHSI